MRIVRDHAGVPHIYASTQADLFFAQGFVQAQDRLFQMDLWRRASLGRLSEILGANFIDRDAMTRRVQYRGDLDTEWASYGADVKRIAEAFVGGINAWVSIVRDHPTEDFALARWPPSYWRAEDLLTRTDAFLESGGVFGEIRRRGLPDAVRDALRLVGTAPFLVGPAPPAALVGVRAAPHATAANGTVRAIDARSSLSAPSPRYLVHLSAPGWNVVGATAPWLPGVAIGHNNRVAWGAAPADLGTGDIVVDDLSRVRLGATELIRVKGRPDMVPFTRDTTPHGVVIASDRDRRRAFVLRWSGFDPGTAAELGALALDRARDAAEFRAALERWKTPGRRIVWADADGRGGSPGAGRAVADRSVADQALFAHPLGVTAAARQRFDVGPVPRPADDAQMQLAMEIAAWDRSRAINAPGQAGLPAMAHYADAAARWSSGGSVELWFSDEAVQRNAEATLTLIPRPRPAR